MWDGSGGIEGIRSKDESQRLEKVSGSVSIRQDNGLRVEVLWSQPSYYFAAAYRLKETAHTEISSHCLSQHQVHTPVYLEWEHILSRSNKRESHPIIKAMAMPARNLMLLEARKEWWRKEWRKEWWKKEWWRKEWWWKEWRTEWWRKSEGRAPEDWCLFWWLPPQQQSANRNCLNPINPLRRHNSIFYSTKNLFHFEVLAIRGYNTPRYLWLKLGMLPGRMLCCVKTLIADEGVVIAEGLCVSEPQSFARHIQV